MSDLRTIRTDVVGSLLRPDAVKRGARALRRGQDRRRRASRASRTRRCATRCELQESVGLDVVSDGEMRRLNFQDSFGAAVEGYDASRRTLQDLRRGASRARAALRRWEMPRAREGHGDLAPPAGEVAAAARAQRAARGIPVRRRASRRRRPRSSLIGPDRISQRFDHENSKAVYKDMDDFMADVVAIEREIVESLVDAGCRYVHIDAPGYTAYVDEPSLAQMRARGEDPKENFARSLKAEAAVIADFPGVDVRHSSLPRQPAQHVAPRGHLRRHRRAAVQRAAARPLPARIRQPARRQLRAAALRAEGQGRGAGPGQHQGAGDGEASTISSAASTRRRSSSRSISSRSARNAASPPTWSAT